MATFHQGPSTSAFTSASPNTASQKSISLLKHCNKDIRCRADAKQAAKLTQPVIAMECHERTRQTDSRIDAFLLGSRAISHVMNVVQCLLASDAPPSVKIALRVHGSVHQMRHICRDLASTLR